MATKQVHSHTIGRSASDSEHGVMVETTVKGSRNFVNGDPTPVTVVTATGHGGKRHASIIFDSLVQIDAHIAGLVAARASMAGGSL